MLFSKTKWKSMVSILKNELSSSVWCECMSDDALPLNAPPFLFIFGSYASPIHGHKHIVRQVNKSVAPQQMYYAVHMSYSWFVLCFPSHNFTYYILFSCFLLLVLTLLSVSTFSFSRNVHTYMRVAYMFGDTNNEHTLSRGKTHKLHSKYY